MLRRKTLLICAGMVIFCLVGVQTTKACGHWELLDCYIDLNGYLWLLWCDSDTWRFECYCFTDEQLRTFGGSELFVLSLPIVGSSEPQDRIDSVLAHDDDAGGRATQ